MSNNDMLSVCKKWEREKQQKKWKRAQKDRTETKEKQEWDRKHVKTINKKKCEAVGNKYPSVAVGSDAL